MKLLTYKPDQGRVARTITAALLVVLAYYAAWTLRHFMSWDWAKKDLGITVPVLEALLTPGLLIATVVFVAMFVLIRKSVNDQRLAELLIDTESEMKRVTWPSWPETWNGTVVVCVTVAAMIALVAGFDFVLTRVFENLVFG
ncbi:MAG: preprotein translocase subunit SecE [Planctomycetes bacterium]|nr:preprotein translocase subunit SecE [Planctomycetota bacterium]